MSEKAGPITYGPAPSFDDADLVPLWELPPAEQARRRAERDRILDMLEEEELIQQAKEEAEERERFQAELQKRKQAAEAEMDALKKAREMQKKMGKALLKNIVVAREREEEERRRSEALRLAEESAIVDSPLETVEEVSFAVSESDGEW